MIITILIPCRNEEKHIRNCIESVLNFDIPAEVETEILLIDGQSTDDTRNIIYEYAQYHPNIRLIDNPGLIQASALNIGIKEAKGRFILRLDAHSNYPTDYLSKIYETYKRTKAENVGGVFLTQPGNNTYSAQVVQALTTHKFGVGNAGFRTGAGEGPADTVPYGFYRKDIFTKIGLFDERLVRAQDYEFNRRIIKSGGKIWRNPEIKVFYYNQSSISAFLKKQIFLEAPYNVYMWYLAPYTFAPRHAITGVFVFGLISGVFLSFYSDLIKYTFISIMLVYFILAILSSLHQALRYKKIQHIVALPIGFFLFHFMHGVGLWIGVLRLVFRTAPILKKKPPNHTPEETNPF